MLTTSNPISSTDNPQDHTTALPSAQNTALLSAQNTALTSAKNTALSAAQNTEHKPHTESQKSEKNAANIPANISESDGPIMDHDGYDLSHVGDDTTAHQVAILTNTAVTDPGSDRPGSNSSITTNDEGGSSPSIDIHIRVGDTGQLGETFPDPTADVLNMLSRLASSGAYIMSLQNDKPEPSQQEIVAYLKELYEAKTDQFLYRFHTYLQESDIPLFNEWASNGNVQFYLDKMRSRKTASYKVARNRRYYKLQELLSSTAYFSDKEMQKREPLLFYKMIGRYETESERQEKRKEALSEDPKFSTFLLAQSDRDEYQQMCDKLEQEEYESDEDEDNIKKSKDEMNQKFKDIMIEKFLNGEDKHVSYQDIDNNDMYDDLSIRSRDAQDSYFDEEEEEEAMCTDVEEREFNPPVRIQAEEKKEKTLPRFISTFK